jgi:hypothetical protein
LGRNEIDFGKVANSSRFRLCGTLRRSDPCHQLILCEPHRRSEPTGSALSRDGITDVGNSGNQTTAKTQGKDWNSGASGRKSGPVQLNQKCGGLLVHLSHELLLPLSSEGGNEGSSGYIFPAATDKRQKCAADPRPSVLLQLLVTSDRIQLIGI